jgi:hypothetical protein
VNLSIPISVRLRISVYLPVPHFVCLSAALSSNSPSCPSYPCIPVYPPVHSTARLSTLCTLSLLSAEPSISLSTYLLAACGLRRITSTNLSTCLPVCLQDCAVTCSQVWDRTGNGPLLLLVCRYTCNLFGSCFVCPSATSPSGAPNCSPVLLPPLPACLPTSMLASLLFAHLSL